MALERKLRKSDLDRPLLDVLEDLGADDDALVDGLCKLGANNLQDLVDGFLPEDLDDLRESVEEDFVDIFKELLQQAINNDFEDEPATVAAKVPVAHVFFRDVEVFAAPLDLNLGEVIGTVETRIHSGLTSFDHTTVVPTDIIIQFDFEDGATDSMMLSDCFNMPLEIMTGVNKVTILENRYFLLRNLPEGVSEQAVHELLSLLSDCHLIRFSSTLRAALFRSVVDHNNKTVQIGQHVADVTSDTHIDIFLLSSVSLEALPTTTNHNVAELAFSNQSKHVLRCRISFEEAARLVIMEVMDVMLINQVIQLAVLPFVGVLYCCDDPASLTTMVQHVRRIAGVPDTWKDDDIMPQCDADRGAIWVRSPDHVRALLPATPISEHVLGNNHVLLVSNDPSAVHAEQRRREDERMQVVVRKRKEAEGSTRVKNAAKFQEMLEKFNAGTTKCASWLWMDAIFPVPLTPSQCQQIEQRYLEVNSDLTFMLASTIDVVDEDYGVFNVDVTAMRIVVDGESKTLKRSIE